MAIHIKEENKIPSWTCRCQEIFLLLRNASKFGVVGGCDGACFTRDEAAKATVLFRFGCCGWLDECEWSLLPLLKSFTNKNYIHTRQLPYSSKKEIQEHFW